jgi:hypothetical protein
VGQIEISERGIEMAGMSKKMAALLVENWNLKHPVGAIVKLKLDNGTEKITKTRSEAYVCDAGYPVCFFEGVRGYYLLERVTAL